MSIVTMSRETGSGGEDIGKGIAEKLGYDYFSKERILSGLERYGKKWAIWGKSLDEHCPTTWEQFDRSFAGFVALVEEAIYEQALSNNVIIMGRGAYLLLKHVPHVLRVLVTASMEQRIKRVSEREHVNADTARRLVEFRDHERSCYIHTVYHRKWTNPEDFDMVLDTTNLSPAQATTLVVDRIPEFDDKWTEDAQEQLRQQVLAARIKSRIIVDLPFFVPTLEVLFDGSMIVVRGVVHSVKERKQIQALAEQTATPTPVKCELHYRGN